MTVSPLVVAMLEAGYQSGQDIAARISEVRMLPYVGGDEPIQFKLDGVAYIGALRGRNRCLCLGFGEENDRGIALRVLVDGHASAQPPEGWPSEVQ